MTNGPEPPSVLLRLLFGKKRLFLSSPTFDGSPASRGGSQPACLLLSRSMALEGVLAKAVKSESN